MSGYSIMHADAEFTLNELSRSPMVLSAHLWDKEVIENILKQVYTMKKSKRQTRQELQFGDKHAA